MLGRKRFEPKRFYQFSLEERVPADHLLRRVAAAVDFAFVRRLTARFYSHTGQPGVDPVVLFKLALLGWLYGIPSERRLAAECRLNLAFMWFLGYDLDEPTPGHSVLSKARARFGVTVYQAFFAEVVRQCERAGLVRGDQLYVDSTLVEADAGAGSVGARSLVARLAGIDDHLAALWQENPAPPAEPGDAAAAAPAAGGPAGGEGPVAAPAAPAPGGPHPAGPGDPPTPGRGTLNAMQASRTDPDAGLVRRPGVPIDLYHKLHVGVDGGAARIITAVEVTPGEVPDEAVLDRLLKEHAGATGRTVAEVVADAKYGIPAVYRALAAAGIRACIPPTPPRGSRRGVPPEQFRYDPAADRFTCPAGQALRRYGRSSTVAAGGGVIYRAAPAACGACPRKAACCGAAAARTLVRSADSALLDRVRAGLRAPAAKRSLRRRKCWVELVIAEAKERHGFRRARLRGRANVRIQAYGVAIAYNLKKLAQALGRAPAAPARALRAPCPARAHQRTGRTRRPRRHPRPGAVYRDRAGRH
jgi:transposase